MEVPEEKGICPLSREPIVNSAFLPSGFVFSYTPLYRYVQEHGRCPVTLAPYTTNDIRKIYDE